MPAKRRKEKHWSFGKLWEITIVNRSKEDEEIMKAWKLVSGIISIILFVLVSLQSCAVGLGNTISSNGEFGGSGGIIVLLPGKVPETAEISHCWFCLGSAH